MPNTTRVAYIDGKINYGRGRAAQVLGQTYDVRRLNAHTNGGISNNEPVLANFPARIRRSSKKVAIENETFALLVYQATCDPTKLQLQDVLSEVGYGSDQGVFTFAEHRPTREVLWVRTEMNCTITRVSSLSGLASQQPASGAVETPGWGGTTKEIEQILTLTNGAYSFQPAANAAPATVYCGIQPTNRIRDTATSSPAGKIPTALYREHFLIYVPDLGGVMINELDRINFPNTDRYEIMAYHSSDETGFTGFVCVAEKLST